MSVSEHAREAARRGAQRTGMAFTGEAVGQIAVSIQKAIDKAVARVDDEATKRADQAEADLAAVKSSASRLITALSGSLVSIGQVNAISELISVLDDHPGSDLLGRVEQLKYDRDYWAGEFMRIQKERDEAREKLAEVKAERDAARRGIGSLKTNNISLRQRVADLEGALREVVVFYARDGKAAPTILRAKRVLEGAALATPPQQEGEKRAKCPACDGLGDEVWPSEDGGSPRLVCNTCNGTGKAPTPAQQEEEQDSIDDLIAKLNEALAEQYEQTFGPQCNCREANCPHAPMCPPADPHEGRSEYGWKYLVLKTNGEPVDEDADYLVLRLDTDEAARIAAQVYAEHSDGGFVEGLRDRLKRYDTAPATPTPAHHRAAVPDRAAHILKDMRLNHVPRIVEGIEKGYPDENQILVLYDHAVRARLIIEAEQQAGEKEA